MGSHRENRIINELVGETSTESVVPNGKYTASEERAGYAGWNPSVDSHNRSQIKRKAAQDLVPKLGFEKEGEFHTKADMSVESFPSLTVSQPDCKSGSTSWLWPRRRCSQ